MADLSPFVIEKCIQSIVGHPKTIKKLKSGDLLLEVDRKQQVENLLKTTKIFDLKVKISLHHSLFFQRCHSLSGTTSMQRQGDH